MSNKQDKYTKVYCVSIIFYNWMRFREGIRNDDDECPKIGGVPIYASEHLSDGQAQAIIYNNETGVSNIEPITTTRLFERLEKMIHGYFGNSG